MSQVHLIFASSLPVSLIYWERVLILDFESFNINLSKNGTSNFLCRGSIWTKSVLWTFFDDTAIHRYLWPHLIERSRLALELLQSFLMLISQTVWVLFLKLLYLIWDQKIFDLFGQIIKLTKIDEDTRLNQELFELWNEILECILVAYNAKCSKYDICFLKTRD